MPFDVVTLGESMIMVSPRVNQPLQTAEEFSLDVGGAESNVALYLQELGHSTTWVSRLGDDALGRRILDTFERYGVDTSLVTIDPEAQTGLYVKDPGSESTRVHYYRRGSAASRLNLDIVPDLPLSTARLIHLSGITPGLSEGCAELVDTLMEAGGGWDALVSFDVNYRAGVWPVGEAAPVLARLARQADIVLVGLDEAAMLWGVSTPDAVRELLPQPARLVVKDGAVGATEFHRATPDEDRRTFVAAPRVEVVEVVGAGDAFAAGYLSAVLRGLPSAEGLALGHALAARALNTTTDYSRKAPKDD
jgi:2-dehydro-3-deoxygluconokinase